MKRLVEQLREISNQPREINEERLKDIEIKFIENSLVELAANYTEFTFRDIKYPITVCQYFKAEGLKVEIEKIFTMKFSWK